MTTLKIRDPSSIYAYEYDLLKQVFITGFNAAGEIITQDRFISYCNGKKYFKEHSYYFNQFTEIICDECKVFLKLEHTCSVIDLRKEKIFQIDYTVGDV